MNEIELMCGVVAKAEKNKIVFYADRTEHFGHHKFSKEYTDSEWHAILTDLIYMTAAVWPNIKPKEATGSGSDFEEYYDKELDNDAWMSIYNKSISISAIDGDHERIYVITKRKSFDFLNTLLKRIIECEEEQ